MASGTEREVCFTPWVVVESKCWVSARFLSAYPRGIFNYYDLLFIYFLRMSRETLVEDFRVKKENIITYDCFYLTFRSRNAITAKNSTEVNKELNMLIL